MSAPELSPCPFCGGEAHIDGTSWTTQDGKDQAWVTCKVCNTYGPSSTNAIAAWNRRADTAAQAEIASLRADLAKAVEALEFYADKDAWSQPPVEVLEGEFGPAYRNKASEMQKDRGTRARDAIKEINK